MKRTAVPFLLLLAGGIILTGCRKEVVDNLTEDEARIYITNYDSTVNFRSFLSYNLVDSVAVIQNDRLQSKQRTDYDIQVLNALHTALQQRGYSRVDKNAQPDLGITVSRITSSYTGVVSYPNYWDYYGSFYDPFYWGYGGYGYYSPFSYGVYEIREGALAIDALNLKNPSNNTISTVWSGLARGSGVFRTSNAATQVNALFEQSPYFRNN